LRKEPLTIPSKKLVTIVPKELVTMVSKKLLTLPRKKPVDISTWCADQCGYLDDGTLPKYAWCGDGIDWFKDRGQWQDNNYEPLPGDVVFFDWNGDNVSDHTGIVESSDGGYVYTIEGNNGDAVRQDSYRIGNSAIQGYGVPVYG
jgi:hypothetical protein